MPGFREIVGHEQIISHLKTAIATDRVSHAYILNGPDHSGKRLLAEAFAMTLQCKTVRRVIHGEDEDEQMSLFDLPGMTGSDVSEEAYTRAREIEPCLECRSCKQAVDKNQPDIKYVTRSKTVISVDDIRDQINNDVVIKPYSSRYKVYIVDEAERMNVQAQNALLKTVEEPTAYVVILLLTTNADSFLPTILSRCVRLDLKPVDDGQIRSFLMRRQGVPDYQADLCVAFAQGNVGRAVMLSSSEQFKEIKDELLTLIKKLKNIREGDLAAEAEQIAGSKENISVFLELILLLFRDVLLYKSSGSEKGVAFRDQLPLIEQIAEESSFAGLGRIIESIETADRRINANVSAALTLEILLLEMKENM